MGARQVSWVSIARVAWTLPSPARHGGCKKRPQPPRRLPSPWMDRERDLGRGRESEKNERERGVTRPTDGNLRHKIAPGLTRVADVGER